MTTNTEIKPWRERVSEELPGMDFKWLQPSYQIEAMAAEIAELRAALQASNTRIEDLTTAANRCINDALGMASPTGFIEQPGPGLDRIRELERENEALRVQVAQRAGSGEAGPQPIGIIKEGRFSNRFERISDEVADDASLIGASVYAAPPAAVQPDMPVASGESPCIEGRDGLPAAIKAVIQSKGSCDTLRSLYRLINIWGAEQRADATRKQPDSGRDAALLEAADACMGATADHSKIRFIGESAHYVACRDAVLALRAVPQGGQSPATATFDRRLSLARDGFGLERNDVSGEYVTVDDAVAVLHAALEKQARDTEVDPLRTSVAAFIKAKGRFHTEQGYKAVVEAFDASTGETPP
jgi:hypothetical protein